MLNAHAQLALFNLQCSYRYSIIAPSSVRAACVLNLHSSFSNLTLSPPPGLTHIQTRANSKERTLNNAYFELNSNGMRQCLVVVRSTHFDNFIQMVTCIELPSSAYSQIHIQLLPENKTHSKYPITSVRLRIQVSWAAVFTSVGENCAMVWKTDIRRTFNCDLYSVSV